MFNNLRWAWKVLWSKSYVILTDEDAVVSLPLVDPDKLEDLVMLQGQRTAFILFKEKFDEMMQVHNEAVTALLKKEERVSQKKTTKAGTKRTRKV